MENLGRKILSRISNFWGGKFGVESAISNLEFGGGGWKIWGGKCYLESRIWGVENLGRKMLSRISNLGGGKFGAENAISVENAISDLEFGVWKIWGGKCYLETPIWGGGGKFGWKMLSRISKLGGGKFGVENAISNLGGGKFGAENAISNIQFGWVENCLGVVWGGKCYLEISNLGGWKIWGGKCYLES